MSERLPSAEEYMAQRDGIPVCDTCKTNHCFDSRQDERKAKDAHGGWPVGTRIDSFSNSAQYSSKVTLPA